MKRPEPQLSVNRQLKQKMKIAADFLICDFATVLI